MIFACSDLHGNYAVFKSILNMLSKEDDFLYILGDVIDRGGEGIAILKNIIKNKSQIQLLLGNHEQLLLDWYDENDEEKKIEKNNVWMSEGGYQTKKAFLDLSRNEQSSIITILKSSPFATRCTLPNKLSFWLSHAGGNYSDFTNPPIKPLSFLTNRTHFLCADKVPNDVKIVHGHTYYKNIPGSNRGVYNDGKKISLDNCTVLTGSAYLMNLNTLEILEVGKEGILK